MSCGTDNKKCFPFSTKKDHLQDENIIMMWKIAHFNSLSFSLNLIFSHSNRSYFVPNVYVRKQVYLHLLEMLTTYCNFWYLTSVLCFHFRGNFSNCGVIHFLFFLFNTLHCAQTLFHPFFYTCTSYLDIRPLIPNPSNLLILYYWLCIQNMVNIY